LASPIFQSVSKAPAAPTATTVKRRKATIANALRNNGFMIGSSPVRVWITQNEETTIGKRHRHIAD
jgi:hypothetical protein